MDTLSKSDFPEIISGKFSESKVLTSDQVEAKIIDNFEKGISTEEIFLKGMNVLDRLEKGKRANIGETRTWGGKKYQKGANGWTPVKEGGAESEKKPYDYKRGEDGAFNIPGSRTVIHHSSGKIISSESEKKTSETKVSGLEIYSKTGGGYGANGEVNGKKVKVDIPKEYMKGLASFSDKGFREKVKNLIAEESKKGGSDETGYKEGSSVKVKSDVNMASLSDFQDKPLTIISKETINMASGPYTEYTVKNSEGKTTKINGRFLED